MEDIRSWFEKTIDTDQGFKAECPRCQRPGFRFSWSEEKNVGCCFTESCPWHYSKGGVSFYRLRAWMKKIGIQYHSTHRKPRVERPKDSKVLLPKEYKLLDELEENDKEAVYAYLLSRGLMRKTLRTMKVGYCSKGKFWGYMIFPVMGEEGDVVYWQGRRFKNRDPKFYNAQSSNKGEIWYQIGGNTLTRTIVIVESIINALTLAGADSSGAQAIIALLGHSMSDPQREHIMSYERNLREVIIAIDPDAQKDAPEMAAKLYGSSFQVKIAEIPEGEDINSSGRMKSWELIRSAQLYLSDEHAKIRSALDNKGGFEYDGYARR